MKFILNRNIFFILAGILVLTGLIYLKTSSFKFVNFDDDENIYSNEKHVSLTIENIKYHYKTARYKALAMWSFMIDNYLFGEKNPGMYHLHNVLLHLLNILLVFLLILRITKKEFTALIVATLFALHPAFVEPVAWVSGRKDLLFAFYSLLSMFAYRKYLLKNQNILWLIPVVALVYLASLAKIQAFTIPLIFLGFDLLYKRKFSAAMVIEKLIMFAFITDKGILIISLALALIIIYVYKKYISDILKKWRGPLFIYLGLLVMYMLLIFIVNIVDPGKHFKLIITFVFLYLVFVLISRKYLKAKTVFFNPFIKTFFFILPVAIIGLKIFLTMYSTHTFKLDLWTVKTGDFNYFTLPERLLLAPYAIYIYLMRFMLFLPQNPMIAYPGHEADGSLQDGVMMTAILTYIFLAVSFFLVWKYFRKNKIFVLGFIWFFASISIVTHIIPIEGRVLAADRYTYLSFIGLFLMLGSATEFLVERCKKSYSWIALGLVTILLGSLTFRDADTWKNSRSLWQSALTVKPKNHFAMYALSLAYFRDAGNMPDNEKALYYSDEAIKLKADPIYCFNRASIKISMSDFSGALSDLNNAISGDSTFYLYFYKRGLVYQRLNNFSGASIDLKKALKLKDDFTEAQEYLKTALRQAALDSMIMAEVVSPADSTEAIQLICNIAEVYIGNKQLDKAEVYLTKGMKIAPEREVLYEKYAVMYQLNKEYDKALAAYNNGLAKLPGNPLLLLGRGTLYLEKGDTDRACVDWKISAAKGNAKALGLSKHFCVK